MESLPLELLAPARDLACGIAAIDHGADAVYIGPAHFGARVRAGNSLEDIAQLVDYAHQYWVKVYATVNTILRDDELAPARDLLHQLYDIGIDGAIIQDVGLLEEDLPPLPLIASTQLNNRDSRWIRFLEAQGFARVIVARELSLAEIKEIRRQTSVELEAFVHGALCVGNSGTCYLSHTLGGRSSNRGECAQPCRLPYRLEAGAEGNDPGTLAEGHLLSLKDLNLSGRLGDLIEAGVTSFKIEGRLKDERYVKNVVGAYHQELDRLCQAGSGLHRASRGKTTLHFEPQLNKSFNRGFTQYGLSQGGEKLASLGTPKSIGEPLGQATGSGPGWVTLDTHVEVAAGDGLCFFDNQQELRGVRLRQRNRQKLTLEQPVVIPPGQTVFRNADVEFSRRLRQTSAERRLPLDLTLLVTPELLELTGSDDDGLVTSVSRQGTFTPLRSTAPREDHLLRQVSKLGGTIFTARQLSLVQETPLFVPTKQLNELRRQLVAQHLAQRRQAAPRLQPPTPADDQPLPVTTVDGTFNVCNRQAGQFFRRHGARTVAPGAETATANPDQWVMTMKYCLLGELGQCPPPAAPAFWLVTAQGRRYRLVPHCDDCHSELWRAKRVKKCHRK
jgi:putative protease